MRAFVTGGASGIGAATARLLAAEGYDVTVADLQEELGVAVAEEIGGQFLRLDVADPGAWHGVLVGTDLVHLNAGVTTGPGDFADLADADYRRVLGVNVDGVALGAREASRSMAGRGGAIVATASVAGLFGFAADPVYTLTKHAVVGLVRALGAALAPQGITVNAVCPGLVETPLVGAQAVELLRGAGYDFLDPSAVAATVLAAARSGRSGECWTVLPGRPSEPFAFADPLADFAGTGEGRTVDPGVGRST